MFLLLNFKEGFWDRSVTNVMTRDLQLGYGSREGAGLYWKKTQCL